MTQNSSPWDGISVGDAANAPYSANEWSHLWALQHGAGSLFPNYGVLMGTGDGTYDPLQVIASGGSNVDVKVGAALVNGKLYETDAAVTLTVGANASGNPRIDTVVLRADYVAQTVRPVILQGTPAGSPARPTLTQSATVWETPLADIAVANGFSSIIQANIADRRRAGHSSAAGWQPYAYGLSHIPNGTYNTNLQNIRQLALPFAVHGNMLVQDITFVSGATTNRQMKWGIYTQDLNDSDAANSVVRLIGGRPDPDGVNTNMTSGNPVTIQGLPGGVFITPGTYWLVIDYQGMYAMPSIIPSSLDAATNKALINTTSALAILPQTLDLAVDYVASTRVYGVRIGGRVLGTAAGF